MGRDLEQYVHPERISSQLICPICTQVLKNPVQTATEHLFCEDELLEWMTRSNLCPITKSLLNPSDIRKPSRIILNMLAELQIYCNYKGKGCGWIGTEEQLHNHLENDCMYHQNFLLQETVEFQGAKLQECLESIAQLEAKNHQLLQENLWLKALVDDYQERLRLFHALIPLETASSSSGGRHNIIAESDEDQDTSFEEFQSIQRRDYSSRSLNKNSTAPSFVAEQKTTLSESSSAQNSPNRSNRGGGGASAKQVTSDAERLQRLQGLRSLTSTLLSIEERKDHDLKESRK